MQLIALHFMKMSARARNLAWRLAGLAGCRSISSGASTASEVPRPSFALFLPVCSVEVGSVFVEERYSEIAVSTAVAGAIYGRPAFAQVLDANTSSCLPSSLVLDLQGHSASASHQQGFEQEPHRSRIWRLVVTALHRRQAGLQTLL